MSRQPTMVQQAHAYLEHRRALGFGLIVQSKIHDATVQD